MPTGSTMRDQTMNPNRLWFGVAGSAVAWFALGLADMFITWRACVHEEQFGQASSHPGARILYLVAGLSLLALTGIAGFMSYKDWQRLSGLKDLLRAEAYEREEFMALAGLFISFTLGFGMIWLFLPVFIIEMCLRIR